MATSTVAKLRVLSHPVFVPRACYAKMPTGKFFYVSLSQRASHVITIRVERVHFAMMAKERYASALNLLRTRLTGCLHLGIYVATHCSWQRPRMAGTACLILASSC